MPDLAFHLTLPMLARCSLVCKVLGYSKDLLMWKWIQCWAPQCWGQEFLLWIPSLQQRAWHHSCSLNPKRGRIVGHLFNPSDSTDLIETEPAKNALSGILPGGVSSVTCGWLLIWDTLPKRRHPVASRCCISENSALWLGTMGYLWVGPHSSFSWEDFFFSLCNPKDPEIGEI